MACLPHSPTWPAAPFTGQEENLGDKGKRFYFAGKKALEEKDYLSLLLPVGMLDYFQVTDMRKQAGQFEIYLEEKNIPPTQFSKDKLTSKGFYEEVTVQDFPLRGKAYAARPAF